MVSTQHPVIFLAPAVLDGLRQRAAAHSAEWSALQSVCDGYLPGTVEWPDGNDNANRPNIGEGYQGSGYFPALLNSALCYQTVRLSDPTKATAYANKVADILTKMSEPSGSHSVDPIRDDGYGIRFFGVGMAIGFDWVHDELSPETRQRVVDALNRWVTTFDQEGFGREHPQGNYFAGYYAGKALAALATEGDNPQAPAQWSDWLNRLHGQMVQPYYAANLSGGGWPEGWNYGPLATLNMWWPVLAARTAKGLDLINKTGAPFVFPIAQGLQLIYFSWPNRKSLDDRGTQYESLNPSPAAPYLYTVISGLLDLWQARSAPQFHKFTESVRANGQGKVDAWQDFLFWSSSAPASDFTTLPLSYLSEGTQTVAVRSSWDTDAVWGAFTSGPYLNYGGAAHEYFDQGSLAIVRGGRQLLVNATGAVMRTTPGTSDAKDYDTPIYDDLLGGGNRDLFNVFYVNNPSPYGQSNRGPDNVTTRVGRFEEGGAYVVMRGSDLEQMYPRSGSPSMMQWTRDIIYLRPNWFVVYDRTQVASSSVDQWQRFHLVTQPTEVASSNTFHRYSVGTGAGFSGSVTTLLPPGHQNSVGSVFDRNKVFNLDVRPGQAGVDQRWLTVFDASATEAEVALAERLTVGDGNVTEGDVLGVHLRAPSRSYVALAGAGGPDAAVAGNIEYRIPLGATTHVVTDLPPSTGYTITVMSGGSQTVRIARGGPTTSTATGVLQFTTGD